MASSWGEVYGSADDGMRARRLVEVSGGPNDGMRIEVDVLAHWLVLPVEREVTLLPPSQSLSLESTLQYWRLPIRGGRAWWAKRTGPHDTP